METHGDPNPTSRHNFSCSETPDLLVPERPTHRSTPIPNRIYVAGINAKVSEDDLWHIFSQYGAVTRVNIVCDDAGISKGYGFVTFVSPDDALKILSCVDGFYVRGRWLGIAQAVQRRHRVRGFSRPPITSHDPDTPQASGTVCAYPNAAPQHSTPLTLTPPPQVVFQYPADYYHQMPVLYPFQYEYPYQEVYQVPGPIMEPGAAVDFSSPSHFPRRPKSRRYAPHKTQPAYPDPHSAESVPVASQTPNPTEGGTAPQTHK